MSSMRSTILQKETGLGLLIPADHLFYNLSNYHFMNSFLAARTARLLFLGVIGFLRLDNSLHFYTTVVDRF